MNLEALLEATGNEHLDDRGSALVSGDADELWSDAFLTRMFNEGQRLLCRRAWCLVDYANPTAGVITLKTGVQLYPLHKSVIRVFDATPSTQSAPLGRTDDIQIRDTSLLTGAPNNAFDAWEIGEAAALAGTATSSAGSTLSFATDAGTRLLRVFPLVDSTYNGVKVYMRVARYPITYLTLEDTNGVPEVGEEYHDDLVRFAAGRALTLPNVDSQTKGEGRALLDEFRDRCREARQDRQRAEASTSRWTFASSTAVLGTRPA